MSKMQDAFDSWMDHDDWRFADREAAWKWMFEAGYQAAIAAIKEGGAYITIPSNVAIGTPIQLYRIPEDV